MLSQSSRAPELKTQPSILVVGEYEALNEFLGLALAESVPCRVEIVASDMQALEVAPTRAPDLLIIDFDLPHLNGFQLDTQLRLHQVLQRVPTILLNVDPAFPNRDDPCLFCLPELFELNELLFLVKSLLLLSDRLRSQR